VGLPDDKKFESTFSRLQYKNI